MTALPFPPAPCFAMVSTHLDDPADVQVMSTRRATAGRSHNREAWTEHDAVIIPAAFMDAVREWGDAHAALVAAQSTNYGEIDDLPASIWRRELDARVILTTMLASIAGDTTERNDE